MPPSHQKHQEMTPERILQWAGKYGPSVKALVEAVIASRMFPEQAYKRCLGIIRLEKHFTADRLNKACERALKFNVLSYVGVKNILQNKLDEKTEETEPTSKPKEHTNLRGAKYFTDCLNDDSKGGNK